MILRSTASNDDAHRFSIAAAKTLDARLDLRDLSPNKKVGLTFRLYECATWGRIMWRRPGDAEFRSFKPEAVAKAG